MLGWLWYWWGSGGATQTKPIESAGKDPLVIESLGKG